jgi:hypothetical protein
VRRLAAVLVAAGLLACGAKQTQQAEPAIQQSFEQGPVQLAVAADKTELSAADSVEISLKIEYPEDAQIALPAPGSQLGDFLVQAQTVDPPHLVAAGRLEIDQHLTLAPSAAGDFTIPALQVSATLADGQPISLQSTAIPVKVTSLLTEEKGKAPELRDIEEPLDAPIPLAWKLGGMAAGLLVIGALVWWVWLRKPKLIEEPPAPPMPPGQAALARLDALYAQEQLEAGDYRQFHFELSDILREYIERRFSLRAQEQTTDEFLAGLPQQRVFDVPQQLLLQDFLRRSDLVKFAKYAPRPEQSRQAAEACRKFVVETDEVPSPVKRTLE